MTAESHFSVLVADDEEMFRTLVMDMLRARQFDCTGAGDGPAVLQALEAHPFDVLICDIRMGGNEDLALVREVGARWPKLKVILMTGYPTVNTAVESVRLTVSDYLIKPFVMEELIAAVKKCVAQKNVDSLFHHSHKKIGDWSNSLNQLLSADELDASTDAFRMQQYVGLTLRNMAGCIDDLRTATEISMAAGNYRERIAPCQYFNCVRFVQMKEALQQAVSVLEQTRRSFKSRELQQLRVFLQQELDSMALPSADAEK